SNKIFVPEIGKILEIDSTGAHFGVTVPSGVIMVDGTGVGDVGNVVLRDRRKLAEEGLIIVSAAVDFAAGDVAAGPEVVSRGFVYEKESEEMMSELKDVARDALRETLWQGVADYAYIKGRVRDEIAKYVHQTTKRKPMIIVMLMEV
ncbi:MAG: ribonuclease J, partial [Clostridia bacterium]|nr:ribonuclease J [Clostridia bacterium]